MFYRYDIKTGKYLGQVENAKYRLDGKLLDGYTKIKPPDKYNDSLDDLIFKDGKWNIVPKPKDLRGKWVNEAGDEVIIKEIGEEPPDGYYQLRNQEYRDKDGNLHEELTKQFKLNIKKSEIEQKYNMLKQQLKEEIITTVINAIQNDTLEQNKDELSQMVLHLNDLDKEKETLVAELENVIDPTAKAGSS